MPKLIRLVLPIPQSKEQIQAVTYLMDSQGLCVCGRFLNLTDAKLCLAQVNTRYFKDPVGRNLLVIAAYCYGCSLKINETLKSLKGSMNHPEPDRRRHENGA